MEHTTAAGTSIPENQEQNILPETKCPVAHGARRHTVAGAPTKPTELHHEQVPAHNRETLERQSGT